MNIGIDARMMNPGCGIGRYIEQLVVHILALPESKEHTFVLFVKKEQIPTYRMLQEQYLHVKFVEADVHWYTWKEQRELPKIIRGYDIDLMHFPHWNVPYAYGGPFVVTVHDLIMYHFPRPSATTLGPLKFFIKDKIHRLILRRAVKKAEHILVPTEFTKHDVHTTLRIPEEKMTVTYEAPSMIMPDKEESALEILEKYQIFKPHVICVGAAYPHKNLLGLLRAWKIFEETYGSDYQLVLVGKKSAFYDTIMNSDEMKACKQVVYTGFVSDSVLRVLYETASLSVIPSLYEGFGLPPLEAMQYGIPVVSSDKTCLPEVLGEAALYTDPENPEQLASVMYTGLTDEHIRNALIENGKRELGRYRWETLAKQTLVVYEGKY